MKRPSRLWLTSLLDLLYPRACEGCGGRLTDQDGRFLCLDCLSQTQIIQPPFCSICGQPISGFIDFDYVCHRCSDSPAFYDHARSCALYDGVIRDLLLNYKYYNGLWMVPDFLMLLSACLETHYDLRHLDGFIAVPLFHTKKRERGYNQAALLAQALSRAYKKPFFNHFLKKNRRTKTQTKLTPAKRKSNVEDAFEVKRGTWLEERRLVLIDDVMTTGATVNECARVLKGAGATKIDVLTVARGMI